MSARHRLADREDRKRRRASARVGAYSRTSLLKPSTRVYTPLSRIGVDTVPGRDARQWNAANVRRLFMEVRVSNPRRQEPGQPKWDWVRKRTDFRNAIVDGKHV